MRPSEAFLGAPLHELALGGFMVVCWSGACRRETRMCAAPEVESTRRFLEGLRRYGLVERLAEISEELTKPEVLCLVRSVVEAPARCGSREECERLLKERGILEDLRAAFATASAARKTMSGPLGAAIDAAALRAKEARVTANGELPLGVSASFVFVDPGGRSFVNVYDAYGGAALYATFSGAAVQCAKVVDEAAGPEAVGTMKDGFVERFAKLGGDPRFAAAVLTLVSECVELAAQGRLRELARQARQKVAV